MGKTKDNKKSENVISTGSSRTTNRGVSPNEGNKKRKISKRPEVVQRQH